ncbi:uncharacterized protein LOC128205865 [Mya arenaria]|uniref:uncharacterized protein LOC128205865 n=1 Tax=Mya arenaria TaxID=6604 RepID=UPI0022E1060D|nr:uncharacterized protein LOC128205865 [Mya arenaria]
MDRFLPEFLIPLLSAFLLFTRITAQCNDTMIDSEKGQHSVSLTLYRAQPSDFATAAFKTSVAEVANSKCTTDSMNCNLNTCCSFTSAHIEVYNLLAKEKDMTLTLHIEIPTGASGTNTLCLVEVQFLKTIMESARESVHSSTDRWITYIDTEFYGIPPPTTVNRIVIPIVCLLTTLLGIVTIVLKNVSDRRDAEERRLRILERRKQSLRASKSSRPGSETSAQRDGRRKEHSASSTSPKKLKKRTSKSSNESRPISEDPAHKYVSNDKLSSKVTSAKITVNHDEPTNEKKADERKEAERYSGFVAGQESYNPVHVPFPEPKDKPKIHLEPVRVEQREESVSDGKSKSKKKKKSKKRGSASSSGTEKAAFKEMITNITKKRDFLSKLSSKY